MSNVSLYEMDGALLPAADNGWLRIFLSAAMIAGGDQRIRGIVILRDGPGGACREFRSCGMDRNSGIIWVTR